MFWFIAGLGIGIIWLMLFAAWLYLYLTLPEPPPDTMTRHIERMGLRYDRAARLD
jgi:hypothetical protein